MQVLLGNTCNVRVLKLLELFVLLKLYYCSSSGYYIFGGLFTNVNHSYSSKLCAKPCASCNPLQLLLIEQFST